MNQTKLKELLHYDPSTGILTWRGTRKGVVGANTPAGTPDGHGYIQITADGGIYRAHRLAWMYVHGEFPPDQTDHINGIKTDNRIENLRCVDNKENGKNMRRSSRNTSGVTGVSFLKSKQKWHATIFVNGERKHIGLSHSIKEAAAMRKRAEKFYGFHENHGSVI